MDEGKGFEAAFHGINCLFFVVVFLKETQHISRQSNGKKQENKMFLILYQRHTVLLLFSGLWPFLFCLFLMDHQALQHWLHIYLVFGCENTQTCTAASTSALEAFTC